MRKTTGILPYYTEINDFLASIPWPERTTNPDFYCLRLKPIEGGQMPVYRPPFKRSFYFFALLFNSGEIKVEYGEQTIQDADSYLVFHSPNLIYSFTHNNALEGYVVYFKPDAFSFFKPGFHRQFTLFDPHRTNLFKFDHGMFRQLAPHFESVFAAYEHSGKDAHLEARLKLLGLLCHLQNCALESKQNEGPNSRPELLMRDFLQLIENNYIHKRSIKEYAALLSVTPNYLSRSVKQVSGRNALAFITERLVSEAKSLVRYTDLEISTIAYQLDFSDPANFGKFFKKHTKFSPSAFRSQHKGLN
ncbi:helix-turn-helix transcriptional regulator [Pedobacter riviphilus]|uniref:Helix-turn-helix transcriptional regulator n=1 Tax=Pedobacter riviphilus TaxID=2766984 RepID=A0ABX6THY8_9SPHI|nr:MULTISPECIES: AraC family transcriptional regulator [Pedobacter]NII81122.1 AraC-like DNA-binding protein [Pedobacter sp. SG908]NMN35139.1 AraC-like DNA-binding protein [Pedobacter sp. SG918]QNR85129.1 helix-turn-helix transcriptional regulator [Pedobacter riviphilus]